MNHTDAAPRFFAVMQLSNIAAIYEAASDADAMNMAKHDGFREFDIVELRFRNERGRRL